MKRTYKHYLLDIIDYCERLIIDSKDISIVELERNIILYESIVLRLIMIGEYVKCLPQEILDMDKSIEWDLPAKQRDYIVHHYAEVLAEILHDTVTNDIPEFLHKLKKIRDSL